MARRVPIAALVERFFLTLLVLGVFLGGYFLVGDLTLRRAVEFPLVFGWEGQLPLLPWMVFPYLLALVLPDPALFGWPLWDREGMRRQALSYMSMHFMCFAIFLLYPVRASLRPEHLAVTSLSTRVLAYYYEVDPPVNLFPSLHCGNAVMAALMARRLSPRLVWVVGPLAGLVLISVPLVKQHYVADVVAGTALALLADALFGPKPPRR